MELAERFWDAAIAVDPGAKQPAIGVIDRQARFQICGPSLVLRKLKQRLVIRMELSSLRIHGAFIEYPGTG